MVSLKPMISTSRLEKRRTASAWNLTEQDLFPSWLMKRQDFSDFLLIRNANNFDLMIQKEDKNDFEKKEISSFLSSIKFFAALPKLQLYALCEKVQLECVQANEKLYSQGEFGYSLYVLFEGIAEIVVDNQSTGKMKGKALIGENVLGPSQYRKESILAKTDLKLIWITRKNYESVAATYKFNAAREISTFIKQIEFFQNWMSYRIAYLTQVCNFKTYTKGSIIYEDGQDPHNAYLLKEGIVHLEKDASVQRRHKWPVSPKMWETLDTETKYRKVFRICQAPDIFGTNELVHSVQRHTRAVAETRTILFIIPRDVFLQTISGEEMTLLITKYDSYPDTAELNRVTANQLVRLQTCCKTLLDATQATYSPKSRIKDVNWRKQWKLKFAQNVVKGHHRRQRKQLVAKRKTRSLVSSRTNLLH